MAALGQGMDQVFAVVTEGSGLNQNHIEMGLRAAFPSHSPFPHPETLGILCAVPTCTTRMAHRSTSGLRDITCPA